MTAAAGTTASGSTAPSLLLWSCVGSGSAVVMLKMDSAAARRRRRWRLEVAGEEPLFAVSVALPTAFPPAPLVVLLPALLLLLLAGAGAGASPALRWSSSSCVTSMSGSPSSKPAPVCGHGQVGRQTGGHRQTGSRNGRREHSSIPYTLAKQHAPFRTSHMLCTHIRTHR